MEIQRNNNVSFQASGVTTARRILKNGQEELIDVLKLNHAEDDSFVRTCLESMNANEDRLNTNLKKMRKFFVQFLNDRKCDGQDYYIGVKNGEMITGGFCSTPIFHRVLVNSSVDTLGSKFNKDNFFYALLTDAKKTYKMGVAGIELNNFFKHDQTSIAKTQIKKAKTLIENRNPNAIFTEFNRENIDLAKLFGVQDITVV